jgi:hypothetical protein
MTNLPDVSHNTLSATGTLQNGEVPANQPPPRNPSEQPNQTNQPKGNPIPADAPTEGGDPLKPFKKRERES